MSRFEHHLVEAQQIETEIVRKGIILQIDWEDVSVVRSLAKAAFECTHELTHHNDTGSATLARIELFGLAQLMLTVMRESAEEDIYTHGGAVWKAFGRALWEEHVARNRNGQLSD